MTKVEEINVETHVRVKEIKKSNYKKKCLDILCTTSLGFLTLFLLCLTAGCVLTWVIFGLSFQSDTKILYKCDSSIIEVKTIGTSSKINISNDPEIKSYISLKSPQLSKMHDFDMHIDLSKEKYSGFIDIYSNMNIGSNLVVYWNSSDNIDFFLNDGLILTQNNTYNILVTESKTYKFSFYKLNINSDGYIRIYGQKTYYETHDLIDMRVYGFNILDINHNFYLVTETICPQNIECDLKCWQTPYKYHYSTSQSGLILAIFLLSLMLFPLFLILAIISCVHTIMSLAIL